MAIFESKNVTLALSTLEIIKHSDRFWSSAEPYIVPVFYKVDGERYESILSFFDTQPPRPGTTEVLEVTSVQFSMNSIPEEDNPFTYTPPGRITGRGSFDSGDVVSISDITFTTDLQPIPFQINLAGIANIKDVLDRLSEITTSEDGIINLNTTLGDLNLFLSGLLGLDPITEACPPLGENLSDEFINYIEAQFNCLIPGTVGGAFVVMEQDEFSEADVQKIQRILEEEVGKVINDQINSITRVNPIPDAPDPEEVADEIAESIKSAMILDVAISIAFTLLFTGPILTLFSWIGGTDDKVGSDHQSFDHTDIADETIEFSTNLKEGGNEWVLNGSLKVN